MVIKARQTRAMSAVEAVTNVAVGFGAALLTQILVFPLFGISILWHENFAIAAIFTAISLVRSYAVRRAFERCK
jgi:hypothetical protein